MGFNYGSIKFEAIESYCRIERIPEVRELTFYIKRMDAVWRSHMTDKDSKKEDEDGSES